MADTVDFTTYTDADCVADFVYYDDNNLAINMTGWSLRMQVRKTADNGQVWIDLGTDNAVGGITFTDATHGAFEVKIPKSKLATLPVGNYVHSLIATKTDTTLEAIWRGSLVHSAGPTRP